MYEIREYRNINDYITINAVTSLAYAKSICREICSVECYEEELHLEGHDWYHIYGEDRNNSYRSLWIRIN